MARHGAVTLFANVVLNGVRNSGPALGGLAFDPGSRQIFVADRDTGMIHRFTLDGVDRGQFDHGVQGAGGRALPPALSIRASGSICKTRRSTAPSPRPGAIRPSCAVFSGWASTIRGSITRWRPACASGRSRSCRTARSAPTRASRSQFRQDPQAGAEISTIAFDRDGRMLLAERGPPTGAYDYKMLATPAGGRALRFRAKQPGENRTPFYWQADGDYAVGFPPNFTNGNGGLALGYGYDSAGNIDPGSCGATLWTTGEQLRLSPDRSLADGCAPADRWR